MKNSFMDGSVMFEDNEISKHILGEGSNQDEKKLRKDIQMSL